MIGLALDTSSDVLSVAIADGEKLIGERMTHLKRNHSVRLMPMIDELCREVGVEATSLQWIAVGVGPGSYTGVRIGVTTGKALAWSLGIPLVGVSSLLAIASNAIAFPGPVCALIDARRGQAYAGLYRFVARPDGRWDYETIRPDAIVAFAEWLGGIDADPVMFVGEDAWLHRETIAEAGIDARFLPHPYRPQRAAAIAYWGYARLRSGASDDPDQLLPNYTQLAEAEAKWQANNRE